MSFTLANKVILILEKYTNSLKEQSLKEQKFIRDDHNIFTNTNKHLKSQLGYSC